MASGDSDTPSRFDPFGPAANADETRQAQHSNSNDSPTDVNLNAVVARSQALTVDIAGKNYESASARRQILADAALKGA
jgi:hypothetical protein